LAEGVATEEENPGTTVEVVSANLNKLGEAAGEPA
jgi:hypothetical protein